MPGGQKHLLFDIYTTTPATPSTQFSEAVNARKQIPCYNTGKLQGEIN